jgi:hypothetical protein
MSLNKASMADSVSSEVIALGLAEAGHKLGLVLAPLSTSTLEGAPDFDCVVSEVVHATQANTTIEAKVDRNADINSPSIHLCERSHNQIDDRRTMGNQAPNWSTLVELTSAPKKAVFRQCRMVNRLRTF